jgi:hypothetical protein
MGGCYLSPTMQAAWGCYSLAAQRCAGACWITSPGQSTCASWRGAWPPRKPTCSWSWAAGWRRQAAVGSGVGWHRSREAAAHAAMSNMGVQQLPGLSSLAAECPPAILPPCLYAMVVLQVERDWQWKLESKEQEIASLTARARQVGEALPAVLLVQHLCSVPLLHTTMFSKPPSLPCLLAVADPSPALTCLPACLPAWPGRPPAVLYSRPPACRSWRMSCTLTASAPPPRPTSWEMKPSAWQRSAWSCSGSWRRSARRRRASRCGPGRLGLLGS